MKITTIIVNSMRTNIKNDKMIKRIKAVVYLWTVFFSLLSCEVQTKDTVKISGELDDGKRVVEFGQLGGEKKQLVLSDDFKFELDTIVKKGYYYFNDVLVYLEPGFNLTMTTAEDEISTKFNGVGSEENNYLINYFKKESEYLQDEEDYLNAMSKDLDDYWAYSKPFFDWSENILNAGNFDSFFVDIERKRVEVLKKSYLNLYVEDYSADKGKSWNDLEAFVDVMKDGNPDDEKKYNRLDNLISKNSLPKKTRTKLKKEIYDGLELNDETLFLAGSQKYLMLLDSFIQNIVFEKDFSSDIGDNDLSSYYMQKEALELFSSQKMKEFFLKRYTTAVIQSIPAKAKEAYATFTKNNTNNDYEKEVTQVYTNLQSMMPGKPSPKFFNYENHAGGTASLDDYKGEYVYIDFWATWCGPCKMEIPYLKEVEKQYQGRNIEFISVSLDTKEDYPTWTKMVNDLQLTGIQLIADKNFESEFVKGYNIDAIPRFVLIGPDGNIISNNANRPSEPELIEVLEGLEGL